MYSIRLTSTTKKAHLCEIFHFLLRSYLKRTKYINRSLLNIMGLV